MKEFRKILHIDEDLCNGCGDCVPSCAEGAIEIVQGKAKVIADKFCDGLGACLGECPAGALNLIEREAEPFDEEAVEALLEEKEKKKVAKGACPGSQLQTMSNCKGFNRPQLKGESPLSNWPVQIRLIPEDAPFLRDADLLITADCVPVASSLFQEQMIQDRVVMMGCPKFDDTQAYYSKFLNIFRKNPPRSVRVVSMEVPCCAGLSEMIRTAMKEAGTDADYAEVIIGINGEVQSGNEKVLV